MRLALSGSRGVFWRPNPRGGQEAKGSRTGRQRGDWWVRWACRFGHIHRDKIGPKSLAQREAERRRLEKLCPKHAPKQARHLLSDVIDEYLRTTKAQKRSWKDDSRYGNMWKERFRGRSLDEVAPADLERVRTDRLMGNDEHGAVTPATVNREAAFLKHVYNVAIRDGKVETNPVARTKLLKEPSGRVRYLTDDEENSLSGALSSDADRQRLTVLLHTGLRKSEFLGLRWQDIDIKAGVLTIPRSKNGEARHIPMTSTVRQILGNLPRPLDRSALVFPNSEGKRDLRWAEKTVPGALAASKIEDFRFHDLRHTFASRLAMEGVDLLTIKELGGWKSLAMVQRYAHLSPSHRSTAIERLANRQSKPGAAQSSGTE
jgi:integrase